MRINRRSHQQEMKDCHNYTKEQDSNQIKRSVS